MTLCPSLTDDPVRCDNCDWTGKERDLNDSIDLGERMLAGGGVAMVPAGDCPECQCFAYFERDAAIHKLVGAFIDHVYPVTATQATDTARELASYRRLHDGLSDMIEGGRLTQADIPDDYDWLLLSLLDVNSETDKAENPPS